MKKIDIHICKGFLKAFLLSLVAFVNIFLLSQIFRIVKLVSDGKMAGGDSILYIVALLPRIIIDVAPLSILLGGLISMNVMASNLEIISLKTSGISFKRIMIFPVIISFLVSMGIFFLSDRIAPKFYEQTRILRGSKGDREIPVVKEKAFLRGKGDYVYYMGLINREDGYGRNIQFIELNPEFTEIKRIITAPKGIYDRDNNVWILEKANITENNGKETLGVKNFKEVKFDAAPEEFITLEKDSRTLTNKELKETIKDIKAVGGDTKEYIQEIAKRYSYPFASFVICFMGLALGSRYVRGASAMSIGISIILGYGYYLMGGVFEAISKNGFIDPFIGNWIPNLLFLSLGIYFVNKAEY
ncbi:MAG: LptF/LptG family permease [Fusobacteriaceae bacterium]